MRIKAVTAVLLFMAMLPGTSVSADVPAELGTVEGKVIWVDFWASWCTPCRRSFPWMNEMHAKYAESGLQIIGVNVDKERELADAFLAETPADFALRFDPDGSLAEEFDVQAMPSSFLISASGDIIARHFGFKLENRADYEKTIREALDGVATGVTGNE